MATEAEAAPRVICFEVRYGWREYLRFTLPMFRHRVAELARAQGRPLPRLGLRAATWIMALAGSTLFARRTWRIGRCHFRIDARGLRRSSPRSRPVLLPWDQVRAVYRYAPGYLVVRDGGGLPIPFRVLGAAERRRLEAWAGPRLRHGEPRA